jgi:hypothetical protein
MGSSRATRTSSVVLCRRPAGDARRCDRPRRLDRPIDLFASPL